jgi:hypothetical protein
LSLFELAFDHEGKCATCDLGKRRLCKEGALLFAAAYEKCEALAGLVVSGPRGQA